MRVAVVAPLVAPLGPGTSRGNQVLLTDVAARLARRGHEVTVYAARGSVVPSAAGLRLVEVAIDDAVAGLAIIPGSDGATGRRTTRTGAGAPMGAATAPTRDPGLVAAFRSIATMVREEGAVAVSQHAFDAEAFEAVEGLPVVHTLHLPPIVGSVVDAARATAGTLAAVSDDSAAVWAEALGRRPIVLRNGVPDLLGPAADAALGLSPDRVAVIAGRISPEKGTADAVRLAQRAGLTPLVVGEAYDAAYAASEVAPLLPEPPRLLDREALARVFSRSAVALMPVCWDEPFGLVAAEAQMAGCPVVGYARGALREIVPEGVGGLLARPGDEDGLVERLRRVGELDRRHVRASALARLGIDATIDAYEQALGGVAGG